ncbi:MAG: hypothetical protein AAF633_18375, partial [Chloroflexota bacterium]
MHNYHDDELRSKVEQATSKVDFVDAVINLAGRLLSKDQEEFKELISVAEEEINSFADQNNRRIRLYRTKLKILRSGVAFRASEFQTAFRNINEALSELDSYPLETLWASRAYRLLGTCYAHIGDKTNLVIALRRALDLARKGMHQRELAAILNILAYFEEPTTKIEMYLEALALATKAKDTIVQAAVAANLAEAYVEQGNLEAAEEHLEMAEGVARDQSHSYLLAYVLNWQGTILGKTGRHKLAREKFKAGIELAREGSDHFTVSSNIMALGKFEQELGNTPTALAHFTEALSIANEYNLNLVSVLLYKLKSDCLAELGDYKGAFENLLKHREIKDDQSDKEKEMQRQALSITHKAETLKLEADLEKKKNIELEKRVAERTLALQTALKRANSSKITRDKFLARMSHELR